MTKRDTKKQDKIMKLYETGLYTLTEIGELMPQWGHTKISRQRVYQIIERSQNETTKRTTKNSL